MTYVLASCEQSALFAAVVDLRCCVIAVECFVAPASGWSCFPTRDVFDFAARWEGARVITLSRSDASQPVGAAVDENLLKRLLLEARRSSIAGYAHIVVTTSKEPDTSASLLE